MYITSACYVYSGKKYIFAFGRRAPLPYNRVTAPALPSLISLRLRSFVCLSFLSVLSICLSTFFHRRQLDADDSEDELVDLTSP